MRRMTVAALALCGVFLALYLTLYKIGVIGHLACGFGSCELVNTSKWSRLLGMPVAAWGMLFYLMVLVTAVVGTSPSWSARPEPAIAIAAMSLVGVIFSAWLTYLELFVIHAICRYCVASAVLVTVIFVVSAWDLRGARSAFGRHDGSRRRL